MQYRALNGVAREIADGLMLEMGISPLAVEAPNAETILEALIDRLARKVVALLAETDRPTLLQEADSDPKPLRGVRNRQGPGAGKRNADAGDEDEDEDEVDGAGSQFPNLKYAKPKYKNMESVLKYIDRDEDKGGVKLVIMNFND